MGWGQEKIRYSKNVRLLIQRGNGNPKQINQCQDRKGIAQCLKKSKSQSKEIAVSNMISIEAMARILVKRGFITKEEIMDEVKQVKLEQEAKRN